MYKIIFLITLVFTSNSWAIDVYNPSNNQLTIPKVNVGIDTYTDVVITVGSIVAISGADTGSSDDTYNASNNQLSIPSVSAGGVVYKNVVITVDKVVTIGGKLPTITWVQTVNSMPATIESIGNYRSRNGFGAFDFFGKGYKSFFFPSGGEFNTPRSTTDTGFLVYSINSKNEIFKEVSPLSLNYIAGFIDNYLQGNFGSSSDSLIFIDQGRESKANANGQFENSYLWRLDKNGATWEVKEFAQELGKQFWHSSNNPIDINGDGILDFSISNLSTSGSATKNRHMLFLSSKNSFDYIDLTSNLCKEVNDTLFGSGSSALIKLASGTIATISFPYLASQYAKSNKGSILKLSKDGKTVSNIQCLDVRYTPLTSEMTDTEGYNSIHVLDLNGDGLDDFIALAESVAGGNSDKYKRMIAFIQNKDDTFTNANALLGLPFTYSLPNGSSAQFSDSVSNEVFVSDINGDGVKDIFFNTQMISQQALDSYGIRGGLLNINGKLVTKTISISNIKLNKESKPYSGYHYILPTELNGDGIIDFLLVGQDYANTYKTATNINGMYFRVSALLSQKN